MSKKITIKLGSAENRLLEGILKSKWVRLETAEQAIAWSLGVAYLFLDEYARLEHPELICEANLDSLDEGITPEPAPSPVLNPYDITGIEPGLAPHPALSPEKDPWDVTWRDLARKVGISRESLEVGSKAKPPYRLRLRGGQSERMNSLLRGEQDERMNSLLGWRRGMQKRNGLTGTQSGSGSIDHSATRRGRGGGRQRPG